MTKRGKILGKYMIQIFLFQFLLLALWFVINMLELIFDINLFSGFIFLFSLLWLLLIIFTFFYYILPIGISEIKIKNAFEKQSFDIALERIENIQKKYYLNVIYKQSFLVNAANCYQMKGDFQRSLIYVKECRVFKLLPGLNYGYYSILSSYYLNMGEYKKSKKYTLIARSNLDHGLSDFQLLYLDTVMQKVKSPLDRLNDIIEKNKLKKGWRFGFPFMYFPPSHVEMASNYYIGLIYKEIGKRKEATKYLKKVIDVGGNWYSENAKREVKMMGKK